MDKTSLDGAFSYTDGIDVWDMSNGTVDRPLDNTWFSFQPTEKLRFDSKYTVQITSNATSVYGIPLDGNGDGDNIKNDTDVYVFEFKTSPEPPQVLSHYPEADQSGVPTSLPAIYINFTHLMDITSVTNALSINPQIPFTPSFSGFGKNLTMVLGSELQVGTFYRVTIQETATDLDRIRLDGNYDDLAGYKFTFSFATKGLVLPVMPQIVNIFPPKNATVPVDAFYIGVTFNVVMNRTSVQQAFEFRNATTELNGTFTWSVTGKSLRFTPNEALTYNSTYFASLLGTAKDMNGSVLENPTNWQYTTEAAPVTTSFMDWIIYGTIIFLVIMVVVLYMANRSLRKDLKRTRVKLKRLKRELGVEEKEEKPETPLEQEEIPEETPPEEEPSIEPEKIE
jgi:hypothetical protein